MSPVLPSRPLMAILTSTRLALAFLLAIALAACSSTIQEPLDAADLDYPVVTVASSSLVDAELDGQTVSGTIVVTTEPKGWMRSVRYFLNGVQIGHVQAEPFSVSIDTTTISDGEHSLKIEPLMANGRSRNESTVFFTVNNAGSTPTTETRQPGTEYAGQVRAADDDAFEIMSTGAMWVVGEPGALGKQDVTDLAVVTGYRFTNVDLAPGSLVQSAHLRLTARVHNTPEIVLRIRAEASDHANAFTDAAFDITRRSLTTAYVDWSIPAWSTGQSDEDTLSPDLSPVIQEVVDRTGWAQEAIVLVIAPAPSDLGETRRRPFSFDDDPARAPRLEINMHDKAPGPDPAPTEPGPGPDPEPTPPITEPEPEPTPPITEPTGRDAYSLRGDPSFSRGNLSSAQRAHYDRVWAEIDGYRSEHIKDALSDNIFVYARTLASHVQAVLIVFRMTGDLALLDYVDTIAEAMRSKLADGWRDTHDGTDGTRDGYLNWVFRPYSSGFDSHVGKDTRQIDEMGAHANVAAIAYALEANRDLTSPTGRDYAGHADFWKDYLVNHFEAKWRERRRSPSGFPIMTNGSTGTYFKWLRWHYYMGLLTGNSAYTAEATRMADIFWDHIYPIATPSGTAFIWAAGMYALDGPNAHLLNATTYTGHFYGSSVEFHLEGFHHWASDEHMRRFARTFTEFIIDTDDPVKNGMASDIGGARSRLHLEPNPGRFRLGLSQYRDRNYAFIAAWDNTGQIARINQHVESSYASSGDTLRLAAGLLFLDARDQAPTVTMAAMAY